MSLYVVCCSRGLNRETCQFTIQNHIHCVECSNARYLLREPSKNKENIEEADTVENDKEKVDDNLENGK